MRIQILSDIHLEYNYFTFKLGENVDVVVLAGDICQLIDERTFEKFIKNIFSVAQLKNNNQSMKVIFVPGNHEYYNSNWEHVDDYLSRVVKIIGNNNFYVLNNSTLIIEDWSQINEQYRKIKFIGSTLWSKVLPEEAISVKYSINDYRTIMTSQKSLVSMTDGIRLLNVEDTNDRFDKSLDFIKKELGEIDILDLNEDDKKLALHADEKPSLLIENDIPCIVVTHHLPSYRCINYKYKHLTCNSAFASNLDSLITKHSDKIKVWIFGHSHASCDITVNKSRLVSNPLGYCSLGQPENKNFKEILVIEV